MPIPDFQSIFRPLLELAKDGKDHRLGEAAEIVAKTFNLTDEERQQLIPSGRKTYLKSRVDWAKYYLQKAGLLEAAERGSFRITERGIQVLKSQPDKIDTRFLYQYPEFAAFHTAKRTEAGAERHERVEDSHPISFTDQTPEESLEAAYKEMRSALATELLQRIKESRPAFFEWLVVKLLLKMGYGHDKDQAGTVTALSHDGGIDGIISADKLGLDSIYVQAKKWEGKVGAPELQQFAGALQQHRARKGVFITTSDFTPDARDFVSRIETRIVLVNGEHMAQLMIDHKLGVSTKATYEVNAVDTDFFMEDS